MLSNWFKKWIVPGAVFQSVIIGGGYGTGREVVEFISRFGPWGGIAAIGCIGILMGFITATCFEFTRIFKTTNYRSFFKEIIGKFWIAYEVVFVLALLLILAIGASAAGTILADNFNISATIGIIIMLTVIVFFNYIGRTWVEKSLTFWGIIVSVVIMLFLLFTWSERSNIIVQQFKIPDPVLHDQSWEVSGLKFFLYNIFILPVILYCAEHIETRKEAIGAGFLAGLMAIFPAIAFHISFMAFYPEIINQDLPTYWILNKMNQPVFMLIYVIALYGTIVQTGVGVLQGINERLDCWWLEKHHSQLTKNTHALIAGLIVICSLFLGEIGIIGLVAKGYGSLAWLSLIIFIIPVLTIGIRKILNHPN